MYEACDTRYGKQEIKWSREIHHRRIEGHYARYNSKWTGRGSPADFISVSLYTGLRISDVATFHVDRMKPSGEILPGTTKAGTHVYTWVPGLASGTHSSARHGIWSVHLWRAYDEGHQRRNRRLAPQTDQAVVVSAGPGRRSLLPTASATLLPVFSFSGRV